MILKFVFCFLFFLEMFARNIHALPYSKQLRLPYHIKTGCLFFFHVK
jgi:hypothetical protein